MNMRTIFRLLFCLMPVALAGWMVLAPMDASADTGQYFYDDLGRVSIVSDTSGKVAIYSYDTVGNVTAIQRFTPPGSGIGIYVLTPSGGVATNQMTILGYGFNATPANNTVKFNGTTATVLSATTKTLVVTVPAGATTWSVTVQNTTGTATSPQPFAVWVPTITTVNPIQVPQGVTWPVTVTGVDLWQASAITFTQAGLMGSIQWGATSTSLPVLLTVGAAVPPGNFAFSVTTAGGTVSSGAVVVTVTNPVSTTAVQSSGLSLAMPNPSVPATGVPIGDAMSVGPPVSVSMP